MEQSDGVPEQPLEQSSGPGRQEHRRQSDINDLEIREKTQEEFLEERKVLVARLSQMRNKTKFNPLHTLISSQIKLTLGSADNPLNWDPALHLNTDLYYEVIKFAMEHQPDLIEGVMAELTDGSQPLETDDVTRYTQYKRYLELALLQADLQHTHTCTLGCHTTHCTKHNAQCTMLNTHRILHTV